MPFHQDERVITERVRALVAEYRQIETGGGDIGDSAISPIVMRLFAEQGFLNLEFLSRGVETVAVTDLRFACATISALAAEDGTLASIYMVNAFLCGAILSLSGSPDQRDKLLPRLREGRLQLAFALTEPEAGSDAAGIKTEAKPNGSGYVLTGEKIYTTGASSADMIIVVARVSGTSQSERAFGLFVVPRDAPGLRIEPLSKLSANDHASCRMELDEVLVRPEFVLGGPSAVGSAWKLLRLAGSLERLIVSAMAAGLSRAITGRATAFARSRHQFGKPLVAFQSMQHKLVDMHIKSKAIEMFVREAISAYEIKDDASVEISMAKCFCSVELQELAAKGMRVMGGRSFFDFEAMSRYYREAPFSLFAGGTAEIQKMIIARGLGIG